MKAKFERAWREAWRESRVFRIFVHVLATGAAMLIGGVCAPPLLLSRRAVIEATRATAR